MTTRATFVVLTAAVCTSLLAGIPNPSYACSCAQRTQEEYFYSSDAVFAGQVVDVNQVPGGYGVVFEVYRYWKGLSENDGAVSVLTGRYEASCGYTFEEGGEYLTYASRSGTSLEVGLCGGTQPLTFADNELAVLGAGIVPSGSAVPADPELLTGARQELDVVLITIVAAIGALSAGLAVLIIRKPKR